MNEDQLLDAYAKQRRERLDDSIFEYVSDSAVTAKETYDDIIDSIKGDAEYHKAYYDKCIALLKMMGQSEDCLDIGGADQGVVVF